MRDEKEERKKQARTCSKHKTFAVLMKGTKVHNPRA